MMIASMENLVAIIVISLLSVSLTVQQDAKPATTFAKSEPIIDPQDGYITKFITHGFDVTKINLFGNLQLENLKDTIFEYEPKEKDTVCSSDDKYCYTFIDSLAFITVLESKRTETTVYRLERALHPLLNANVSDQIAGNYSYRLNESSYYGRVSAESIYYQSYWNLKLAKFDSGFFELVLKPKFEDDVKNLAGKNMSDYFKFIEQYGTHYFKEVTFGGMYRMESKATDRFVNDVSEAGYKAYLAKNIQRATGVNDDSDYASIPLDFYYQNHYHNFTYGGDSNQIDYWQKTIEANIVPIGWTKDSICNLILDIGKFKRKNFTEIVKNLKLAIKTIEVKFKIQSYLDALKVIQNNLYGRKIGGKCNPYNIQKYLEDKLNETYPVLDQTFEDNCWCVQHDAESILNRRSWFIRPLPTVEPHFSKSVVSKPNLS